MSYPARIWRVTNTRYLHCHMLVSIVSCPPGVQSRGGSGPAANCLQGIHPGVRDQKTRARQDHCRPAPSGEHDGVGSPKSWWRPSETHRGRS